MTTFPFTKSRHKLQGNTLVEVLISLSLISLLFVMGMMLFGTFTGINSPSQSFRNRALLENYLERPIDQENSYQEEAIIQGRTLQRKVQLLDRKKGLFLLEASCSYGDKLLERRSKLITIYQ